MSGILIRTRIFFKLGYSSMKNRVLNDHKNAESVQICGKIFPDTGTNF